jgi:hypothetical protein
LDVNCSSWNSKLDGLKYILTQKKKKEYKG